MAKLRGGMVEGRTEGPVHATCEVIARRREGAYWLLSFAAKEIAERAQPGQFVQLAVEAPHTLLRRPFSIARVSRTGASAGTVDVVFDAHGPGTEWLTTVSTHDVIDVIGPLGTPFPLPQRKVNCLLVGGGYGAAPLYYLAEVLLRQGLRVDMINGAATASRIMGAIEAKRLSASVTFTTEDGSLGRTGRVTDVIDEVLDSSGAGVVYACGPNPMLRAVSERCAARRIPVQVAVEELMGCGIGVCFTCVVPVAGTDSHVRNKRACIDGPVFNGARIDWDRWGVPGGPGPGDPSLPVPVPAPVPGRETAGPPGSAASPGSTATPESTATPGSAASPESTATPGSAANPGSAAGDAAETSPSAGGGPVPGAAGAVPVAPRDPHAAPTDASDAPPAQEDPDAAPAGASDAPSSPEDPATPRPAPWQRDRRDDRLWGSS